MSFGQCECKSSNSKIEPAGHKSVDFIIGLLGRISDEYEEIHMLIVSIQIVPYKGNWDHEADEKDRDFFDSGIQLLHEVIIAERKAQSAPRF